MFAIRDERYALYIAMLWPLRFTDYFYSEYVQQEDLMKAVRKVGEAKKHESQFFFCHSIDMPDPVFSQAGVYHLELHHYCIIGIFNRVSCRMLRGSSSPEDILLLQSFYTGLGEQT